MRRAFAIVNLSLLQYTTHLMKEEIAALKDRITDLKEKLQEIRGYL
jgi:hypothetical protein